MKTLRRLAALLAAAACAGVAMAAPTPAVEVGPATMRAPREGFAASVVMLTLKAPADTALVGASLTGARGVELHRMQRDGTVVEMRQVPRIELPAGRAVPLRLGEGAYHLMAIGLRPAPVAGTRLVLQLRFAPAAGGGPVRVQKVPVTVLPAAGGHADDDH